MAYGAILGQTPDLSAYATNANLEAVEGEVSNLSSNALLKSGGTMTGQINMNSQKITNVANGTNSGDAVNYGQLNNLSNKYIPFSGSGLNFIGRYTGTAQNNRKYTIPVGQDFDYAFINIIFTKKNNIICLAGSGQVVTVTYQLPIMVLTANSDIITTVGGIQKDNNNLNIYINNSSYYNFAYDIYLYS